MRKKSMPSSKTTSHQHSISTPASPIDSAIKGPGAPLVKTDSKLKPVKTKASPSESKSDKTIKSKDMKLPSDKVDVDSSSSEQSAKSGKQGELAGQSGKKDKESPGSKLVKVADEKATTEKAETKPTRRELKIQQHRKKILLAGCEPSMSMNYDTLAMDDYPSNQEVASAKFERDFWYAVITISGIFFASGFSGLVPAWIAGSAFGISSLSAAFYYSPLREKWMGTKSFSALITKRKAMEFKALTHIQFLEGSDGLAWRCAKMHKYNSNLARKLFEGLAFYSKERNLHELIKRKKQIRLYLLFMMESQKAYKRLQKDYLEHHFKHFDQEGWDDNLTDEELADFEANESEFEDDDQKNSASIDANSKKAAN